MRPGLRATLAMLSALAIGGCAGPGTPSWFSSTMMEELRTQQEYADFIAARYAGLIGDAASAAKYYRRAYDSAPGDASLLERATLSTLASGDAETAVAVAKGARPQVADDSASAQLALIVDDIAAGRTKSAQTRLGKPVLGALNVDMATFLSAWLAAFDNPQVALADFDALPGRRTIAGEQAALRAMILMKAGQDDEAAESFRNALRLPLASRDLVAALGARLQASRGDQAGARDLIRAGAAGGEPGAAGARVLADLDAGRAIQRPKFDPRNGAALAIYIVSGTGLVHSSPELSAMRHALALYLDPDLAPARLALADAYERQDRNEDAIAVLRDVGAASPWAGDAQMEEAVILSGMDKPAEALAAADQALSVSQRRDLVLRAGDLNRQNGRLDVASRLYDQVLAADAVSGAGDWRVLFARAGTRSDLGDWEGAETDLKAALALEPDRPELLNYLGYGWVKRGERVKEGLALIQRAAEARPDQGYIIDSLGWAHYQLGHYDLAVETLERAAELSPTDPEVMDHLGDAYWRAGRRDDARFEWTAALNRKPDPVREASLKQKLDGGLPAAPGARLASRP